MSRQKFEFFVIVIVNLILLILSTQHAQVFWKILECKMDLTHLECENHLFDHAVQQLNVFYMINRTKLIHKGMKH